MLKHFERDYNMTLTAQKKKIAKEYPESTYIMCSMEIITIFIPSC